MTPKKRRLWYLSVLVAGFSGVALVVFITLQESMMFFVTPTQLLDKPINPEKLIRLGGVVVKNSIDKQAETQIIRFSVMDKNHQIQVSYRGVLPNLFQEGQVVVLEGYRTETNAFQAKQVLAKHDESYQPLAQDKTDL